MPRERFSCTQRSLDSIVANTREPYNLVYVDGNSPKPYKDYLHNQAKSVGMKLLRQEQYLAPNQARNVGLREVQTKYTVFVDNDVVVTPGWLEKLVRCAEETNAGTVGPLICQNEPAHTEIHCAGGESGIRIENQNGIETRHFVERIYHQGRKLTDMLPGYRRVQTGLTEFHCVLAQTDMLHAIGGLDEGLLSSKEHVDFSITTTSLNKAIFFEPESLVTYLPGTLAWSDIPYYMLRWSDEWERKSLFHLRDKYGLSATGWLKNRLTHVGWRRRRFLISPWCRRMTFGLKVRLLENLFARVERPLNRLLTKRHYQTA
ncbi:MAG: glycosyltransferase [Planctomycetota bacterium]|nr:glycosyltransferase [Planctomycetota bacterium]